MSDLPVIVFDLGKVLLDFDYAIGARRIAGRSRRNSAEVQAIIEQSRLIVDYESGRMSRKEFYEAVREATGYEGTLEEFSGSFGDIFTPIEPMIGLQRTLREKGFRTYVLSNTNDMAVEHIRREYPFFGNFDGYVYSFETGVLKPQAGIYEAMEALCGRRGADIIYLDDRPNNAEAGASRGWRTILHELPGRSCELLKRMLPKC